MIPTNDDIQLPIMNLLKDREPHEINEVTDKLARQFKISPDELKQLTPIGRQPRVANRVRWAVSLLRQAQLLHNIQRGTFKITESGLELLKTNPTRIDTKLLMSIP